MPFNPEIKHRERACVHDAQAVRLSRREGKCRVLVEAHPRRSVDYRWGGGGSRGDWGKIGAIVGEID